ncbi:serine hydrolase domain-containing protein [Erythrobacter sp. NE805]|uniref:serine hydrolase domain-containing protein n=1 Tax=Erythrobacter sp. NE805 TaxID=3389875 RepID=UPI00396AF219
MSVGGLDRTLASACEAAGVGAASLAVLDRGRIAEAGYGIARPDLPFRMGSIAKTFTAALVHLAAREGRLDLDAPVTRTLPGFRLADPEATALLTARHLLTHRGGFFGDIFDDEGCGPDAIERYVRRLAGAEQTVPPGTLASYCNAGIVLAARLAEAALGEDWESLFAARLARPFGLDRTIPRRTDPGQAVMTTAADAVPAGDPALRALGPAGATPYASAGDLVRWAAALWQPAPAGLGLIGAMTRDEVPSPSASFALGFGPGLMRFSADGAVWGHDGAVPGQASFLRIAPAAGVAVALMVAGGDARLAAQAILPQLLADLAGSTLPAPPTLEAGAADPAALGAVLGEWRAPRYRIAVRRAGAHAVARFAPAADAGDQTESYEVALHPIGGGAFASLLPGSRVPSLQQLHTGPGGESFLAFRGRLFRRAP